MKKVNVLWLPSSKLSRALERNGKKFILLNVSVFDTRHAH